MIPRLVFKMEYCPNKSYMLLIQSEITNTFLSLSLSLSDTHTYLAVVTVLSFLPPTVLSTASIKWRPSTQHHEQYDPKAPKVTLLVVVKCLTQESVNYLRGHVLGWTNGGGEDGRGCGGVVTAHHTAKVKVTDTHWCYLKMTHNLSFFNLFKLANPSTLCFTTLHTKNLVLSQIPVNKFAQKVFHLTLSSLSQSMLSGLRSLWAMQFVWRKSSAEVTSRMTRLASLSVNLSFCWMCLRRWPPNIRSNTRLNCLSSSKKSTRFRTFLRKWEKCVFINKTKSPAEIYNIHDILR